MYLHVPLFKSNYKINIDIIWYICNFAETDSVPADQVNEDTISPNKDDPIKPLERKALNFLVNEYLLQNNYKLTSVTFSEENEEQVQNGLRLLIMRGAY